MMNYTINGYVITNPGKVRDNNEDNFNLFGEYKEDVNVEYRGIGKKSDSSCALAAVLDGMGGEEAGEVASLVAAESINAVSLKDISQDNFAGNIKNLILYANKKVCDKSVEMGGKRIGSTFVGACFCNNKFFAANVGDSRCYLYRNNTLYLMSHDHSIGQRMIDTKEATEEEARKSKFWHMLTQHLGISEEEFCIEPYFSEAMEIEEGDIFILCSDGLTDMVLDDELKTIIYPQNELKDIVGMLVNTALEKGGKDNVTVMVLRVSREENGFKNFLEKLRNI